MSSLKLLASEFSKLIPFDAPTVRVVGEPGAPRFIAGDVCYQLDLVHDRCAMASLSDEEKSVAMADSFVGRQEMIAVDESGFYALLLRSHQAQAVAFRRWVTGEVLPALRRASGYGFPPPQPVEVHGRAPALPPAPTEELSFAHVIDFAIGHHRDTAYLTPKLVAEAAWRQQLFTDILPNCSDAAHVSRFLRHTARMHRRWLCLDTGRGKWAWISPVGKRDGLHYYVARCTRRPELGRFAAQKGAEAQ